MPISNFVKRVAAPSVGTLNRIDGQRTITVDGNIREGAQTAAVQKEVTDGLARMDLGTHPLEARRTPTRNGRRRAPS